MTSTNVCEKHDEPVCYFPNPYGSGVMVKCPYCLYEDYKKLQEGFGILMDYWDILPDDDKPEIDRQLTELGL